MREKKRDGAIDKNKKKKSRPVLWLPNTQIQHFSISSWTRIAGPESVKESKRERRSMPNSRFPQLLSTVIHHGPTLLSWQNDMCHLSNRPLPRSPVLGAVPPLGELPLPPRHRGVCTARGGDGRWGGDTAPVGPLTMPLQSFLRITLF